MEFRGGGRGQLGLFSFGFAKTTRCSALLQQGVMRDAVELVPWEMSKKVKAAETKACVWNIEETRQQLSSHQQCKDVFIVL